PCPAPGLWAPGPASASSRKRERRERRRRGPGPRRARRPRAGTCARPAAAERSAGAVGARSLSGLDLVHLLEAEGGELAGQGGVAERGGPALSRAAQVILQEGFEALRLAGGELARGDDVGDGGDGVGGGARRRVGHPQSPVRGGGRLVDGGH